MGMGVSNPQMTHVLVFHLPGNRVYGTIDYIYIQIKYLDKSSTCATKKLKYYFWFATSLFSAHRLVLLHLKVWSARIYLGTN